MLKKAVHNLQITSIKFTWGLICYMTANLKNFLVEKRSSKLTDFTHNCCCEGQKTIYLSIF